MRPVVVACFLLAPWSASAEPATTSAEKPVPPVETRELVIVVTGKKPLTLARDVLEKMAPLPSQATGGKAKQYPLRDVIATLVDPKARVQAVGLGGGQRVVVDEKMWTNPSLTPVLWLNRRGLFKLGWVDARGKAAAGAPELRDVLTLEVAPPP